MNWRRLARATVKVMKRAPVWAVAGLAAVAVLSARGVDGWLVLGVAAVFFVILLFAKDGRRFAIAALVTAPLVVALLHDVHSRTRLILIAATLFGIVIARWIGVEAWPDAAVIFVGSLAAAAVFHAWRDPPPPKPAPEVEAVAMFVLPRGQVENPALGLTHPQEVDIIALTPRRQTVGGPITYTSKRVSAMLLSDVGRAVPARPAVPSGRRNDRHGGTWAHPYRHQAPPPAPVLPPVRMLVPREDANKDIATLATAAKAHGRFVIVPRRECHVVEDQTGLRPSQVEAILLGYGFAAETATLYAGSFSGRVEFLAFERGDTFKRYFSDSSKVGHFLTHATFTTADAARKALNPRDGSVMDKVQTVTVAEPTMVLRGSVRGGQPATRQYVVLKPACLAYGEGRRVESD